MNSNNSLESYRLPLSRQSEPQRDVGKMRSMKTKEQKILERDDDLLKREGSLRRSRGGSIVFVILFFLVLGVYSESATLPASEDKLTFSLAGCILLCIILAYQYGMQIKHIDSIKLYRKQIEESQSDGRRLTQ